MTQALSALESASKKGQRFLVTAPRRRSIPPACSPAERLALLSRTQAEAVSGSEARSEKKK